MRYNHGAPVSLINIHEDRDGNVVPAGTQGVVIAGKRFGRRNYYTVSFPRFGLIIVEENELASTN